MSRIPQRTPDQLHKQIFAEANFDALINAAGVDAIEPYTFRSYGWIDDPISGIHYEQKGGQFNTLEIIMPGTVSIYMAAHKMIYVNGTPMTWDEATTAVTEWYKEFKPSKLIAQE